MPVLVAACGLLSPEPTPTPTRTPTPSPTPVAFSAVTFNVPAGQEHDTGTQAGVGHRFEFRFSLDFDINVNLNDPHGFEVGRWHRLDSHSGIQHVAEKSEVYLLRFDNTFPVFTSKRVSLQVRVVPP